MIPPDWTEVHPFPVAAARQMFTGTTEREHAIAIRYYRRPPDGRLIAVARFGPGSEGAPGQAHGGAVLTVLDEALGAHVWLDRIQVVTVRLNAEFRKPVPLDSELHVETELTRSRRRMLWVRGELLAPDGTCHARAEAQFFRMAEGELQRLLSLR